jgi:hypothetical protein
MKGCKTKIVLETYFLGSSMDEIADNCLSTECRPHTIAITAKFFDPASYELF